MASRPGSGGTRRAGARARLVFKAVAYALLLAEVLVILVPSVYGRLRPRLFGIPFFYWFQLAWIIVAMAVTGIAYLLVEYAEAGSMNAQSDSHGGQR